MWNHRCPSRCSNRLHSTISWTKSSDFRPRSRVWRHNWSVGQFSTRVMLRRRRTLDSAKKSASSVSLWYDLFCTTNRIFCLTFILFLRLNVTWKGETMRCWGNKSIHCPIPIVCPTKCNVVHLIQWVLRTETLLPHKYCFFLLQVMFFFQTSCESSHKKQVDQLQDEIRHLSEQMKIIQDRSNEENIKVYLSLLFLVYNDFFQFQNNIYYNSINWISWKDFSSWFLKL